MSRLIYCDVTGKQAYRTESEAHNALRGAQRFARRTGHRNRREVRAYECPHCGKWHLTSSDGS